MSGLLHRYYVPEDTIDDWETYIANLDYRSETGGDGGTRTISNPILVLHGTTRIRMVDVGNNTLTIIDKKIVKKGLPYKDSP